MRKKNSIIFALCIIGSGLFFMIIMDFVLYVQTGIFELTIIKDFCMNIICAVALIAISYSYGYFVKYKDK